jgi:hypothetical protein
MKRLVLTFTKTVLMFGESFINQIFMTETSQARDIKKLEVTSLVPHELHSERPNG